MLFGEILHVGGELAISALSGPATTAIQSRLSRFALFAAMHEAVVGPKRPLRLRSFDAIAKASQDPELRQKNKGSGHQQPDQKPECV
jgi:hypothetical protein